MAWSSKPMSRVRLSCVPSGTRKRAFGSRPATACRASSPTEALIAKLQVMVPELLELNRAGGGDAPVELVARLPHRDRRAAWMGDFGPKVRELPRANGCRFDRQGKGDHEIWYSPLTERKFPVDRKIKSRHAANGIMKQAGIDKRF